MTFNSPYITPSGSCTDTFTFANYLTGAEVDSSKIRIYIKTITSEIQFIAESDATAGTYSLSMTSVLPNQQEITSESFDLTVVETFTWTSSYIDKVYIIKGDVSVPGY